MNNISKVALCGLLAGLTLSSCSGGGSGSTSESTKTKGLAPRQLVIEGRGDSIITFHNVRYPNPARADGLSAPRDMVMVIQGYALPPTPTYPTAPDAAAFSFDFGPSEEGEAPHAEKVEGPGLCLLAQGAAQSAGSGDMADNCVGGIQLRIFDNTGQQVVYFCPEFALEVTGVQVLRETESQPDPTVVDPENPDFERWIHERDVVYTGVVKTCVFDITNMNEVQPDGSIHSVPRELNLNGCPFTWECSEVIVDYAYNFQPNPTDPIIGL